MGRCAVATIQRDEHFNLPLWIAYYGQHFDPHDMYILDHESSHPDVVEHLRQFELSGGHVVPVFHPVVYASAEDIKVNTASGFIRDTVVKHVAGLQEQYEYVLYTDSDELVIPKAGTLCEFIDNATESVYRCTGREVIENTQHVHPDFHKALLASTPLNWSWGFHYTSPDYPIGDELWLYHLHRLNFDAAWAKDIQWHGQSWTEEEAEVKRESFKSWFYAIHSSAHGSDHLSQPLEPLDDRISAVLADLGVSPPPGPVSTAFPDWQVPNVAPYIR